MAYQERMIRENLADRLGGIPKREKRSECRVGVNYKTGITI